MLDHSAPALRLALPKLGWERLETQNKKVELWVPSEGSQVISDPRDYDDPAIYVPTDIDAPDFTYILDRAIRELSRVSLESVNEALDLATRRIQSHLDEFEVKSDTPHGEGIVPWEQGVNLVQGARTILDAAARTAQANERYFAQRSATIASNFLEGCYMGQTRVGSYIVTALIPAQQEFSTTTSVKAKKNSLLSGRTISETMVSSLQKAHEVVEDFAKSSDDEVFEWGVSQGLSFELFKGIDEVIGNGETEMVVEFLPLIEEEFKAPKRHQITFTPKHKSAVKHARQVLSRAPRPMEVVLSGEVTNLARQHDDPDSARIKLKALFRGKVRTFTVKLSEDYYAKAVEAHKNQTQLGLVGTADKSVITYVQSVYATNASVSEEKIPHPQEQRKLF